MTKVFIHSASEERQYQVSKLSTLGPVSIIPSMVFAKLIRRQSDFLLYSILKSMYFENGGAFVATTKELSRLARLSHVTIVKAKKALLGDGLITIEKVPNNGGGGYRHRFDIVDVWEENNQWLEEHGDPFDECSEEDERDTSIATKKRKSNE